MDAKNILIPAGLLYYSYSSNEELKAIIEQQRAIIQQQTTINKEINSEIKTLRDEIEDLRKDLEGGDKPGSPYINTNSITVYPILQVADLYGQKCDCNLNLIVYYLPKEITDATPALRILGMVVCDPGFVIETDAGNTTLEFCGLRDYSYPSTRNKDSVINGLNFTIYPDKKGFFENVLCEKDYKFWSSSNESEKLRKQLLKIHNEIRVSEGKRELKYYSSLGSTVEFPKAGKVTIKLLCMKAGLPESLSWLTFKDLDFTLIRYNDIANKREIGTIIPMKPDDPFFNTISEPAINKANGK